MYHVSAQGVDERMINVHDYYYYLRRTETEHKSPYGLCGRKATSKRGPNEEHVHSVQRGTQVKHVDPPGFFTVHFNNVTTMLCFHSVSPDQNITQFTTYLGTNSKHWFTTSFLQGRCRKAMLSSAWLKAAIGRQL